MSGTAASPDAPAPSVLGILASLPADQAAILRRHLPPWVMRAERLALRDTAIQEAARFYPGWRNSRVAHQLATDLTRYRAGEWRHLDYLAELPLGTEPKRAALHRLLYLMEGEVLGSSQLYNVLTGRRRR